MFGMPRGCALLGTSQSLYVERESPDDIDHQWPGNYT
jgi:hypothetical protein